MPTELSALEVLERADALLAAEYDWCQKISSVTIHGRRRRCLSQAIMDASLGSLDRVAAMSLLRPEVGPNVAIFNDAVTFSEVKSALRRVINRERARTVLTLELEEVLV